MPESEETTVIITNVTLLCAAFEIVGKQLIILFSLFFFFLSPFEAFLRSTLITYMWISWWMKFSISIAVGYARQTELESFGRVWLDRRLIISAMWSVSCCKAIHFISNPFDFICVVSVGTRARSPHTNFIPLAAWLRSHVNNFDKWYFSALFRRCHWQAHFSHPSFGPFADDYFFRCLGRCVPFSCNINPMRM